MDNQKRFMLRLIGLGPWSLSEDCLYQTPGKRYLRKHQINTTW